MTGILGILLAFCYSFHCRGCIFYVAVSGKDVYVVCVTAVSMLVICVI